MKNSFYYPAMRAMNNLALDTGFIVAHFMRKKEKYTETFKFFFKLLLTYQHQTELLQDKVEGKENDK